MPDVEVPGERGADAYLCHATPLHQASPPSRELRASRTSESWRDRDEVRRRRPMRELTSIA